MARRPLSPPDRKPGFAVERHSVDARRLVTIGPEHAVWTAACHEETVDAEVRDAIVRMQPPATVNAETVSFAEFVVRRTAAAVKVLPPVASERVLLEQELPSAEASLTVRQVVFEMVTIARTGNRDLLVDVMEEALCAAGL